MIGKIGLDRNGDLVIRIPYSSLKELVFPIESGCEGVGLLRSRPNISTVLKYLDRRCRLHPISDLFALDDGFFGFPAKIIEPTFIHDILESPIVMIKLLKKTIPKELNLFEHLVPKAFNLEPAIRIGHEKVKKFRYFSLNGKKVMIADCIVDGKKTHVIIGSSDTESVYYGLAFKNGKQAAQVFIGNIDDVDRCEDALKLMYDYDNIQLKELNVNKFLQYIDKNS
jgi:hypothetical protein